MPHVRPIAMAVLLAMYGITCPAEAADELQLPERIERALRDMMGDVKPTLDDAFEYMRSLGAIDDPRNYEMPEVLPNGDIIIRRREDAPERGPDTPEAPDAADGPGGAPDAPPAPPEDLPSDPDEGVRT